MEQLTQQLADGLTQAAQDAGVPLQVNMMGSMLTLFFSASPVTNVAQAKASGSLGAEINKSFAARRSSGEDLTGSSHMRVGAISRP